MVGLGASAGGLEALQALLGKIEADLGVAYVVVTHQKPDGPMLLPSLLAKYSALPVSVIEQGIEPQANHIYVAPPGPAVSLARGRFAVGASDSLSTPHLPIDHFFQSLARECQEGAIAVVLSGTGSDGTIGSGAIKAAGGFVFAQDSDSARFSGMPSSAAASHLADAVCNPGQIAEEIARLVKQRASRKTLAVSDTSAALQRLLRVLKLRTGHDFGAYKKSTLVRRIDRRMNVRGVTSVDEYCKMLEDNQQEAEVLFRELLISVTSFFRDPEVFAALRDELRALLEAHDEATLFRAWVPACATGEEAYSIAIVLKELLAELGKSTRVQVFATDLDPQAVDVARAGRYPLGIAADVGPERLERFFSKHENEYRIKKDVRELLVFAAQNVIKDPPFTRLNLVSCRNLFIYLEAELQRRVLSLFSYALVPGGLLLLGSPENISGHEDVFVTVDKKHKLYTQRRARLQAPSEFPEPPEPQRHARIAPGRISPKEPAGTIGPVVERVLLTHATPPSILTSERGDIVYFHGRTGEFLEPAAGEPSANVFAMAREGLRLELPTAMRQAAKSNEPIVRPGLWIKTNGSFSSSKLTVRRLAEPELVRNLFLITVEREPGTGAKPSEARDANGTDRHRLDDLELELQHTRENLQGTIEELETSNEELKSTNEELQSTNEELQSANEELQSANEELETSREEMQSLNEELQTVNAELQERNNALSRSNDDMQDLLNSTDIAIVFLDENLAIKRFTTQARKVFSLIDTDVGRPISDLTANIRYDGLVQDAREVLQSLLSREQEIQTREGAWRLMRIMPYRTAENMIDGLVITFIDIDRLKRNEGAALAARLSSDEMLEALPTGIATLDPALTICNANSYFYELLRTTPKRALGERLLESVLEAPELSSEFERVLSSGAELRRHRLMPQGRLKDKQFWVNARRFQAKGQEAPWIMLMIDEASVG